MFTHYDKNSVKDALTIDDIFDILEELGAEPEYQKDNTIICKTICHNHGDDLINASRKLYYYSNGGEDGNGVFQCYTNCGSFDIFELIQKVKGVDFDTAIFYVVNFFNLNWKISDDYDNSIDLSILEKWKNIDEISTEHSKVHFPEINPHILDNYPRPRIPEWEKEFIPKEITEIANIRFNPLNGKILIPHYDENNRLIGIRERALIKDDEMYGKYRPAIINGKQYNHALGFNLYNLNHAKKNIQDTGIAIVVESEKASLQISNYLGMNNTIAVAVCGNSLSNYQLQLLRDAGAKEIVIGFDADYHELGDDDSLKVVEKLKKLFNKYKGWVSINFLFDKKGDKLPYKASPSDMGKEIFMELWNDRVYL